jgi:hypothetical protein
MTTSPLRNTSGERSPEQVAHEQAVREVGDTLLNIEQAIKRGQRARRSIEVTGREPDLALALGSALEDLERVRKTLFQSAYLGGDQPRLL